MVLFTPEQKNNFKKDKKTFTAISKSILPDHFVISDGFVKNGDSFYWHSDDGPQIVCLPDDTHHQNINQFPEYYSILKPSFDFVKSERTNKKRIIYHYDS